MTINAPGVLRLLLGNTETTPINWISDTNIQLALSNTTHVPHKDDIFYDDGETDDLLDGELSGPGYTAGGADLSGQTFAYDAVTGYIEFDAADVTFTLIDAGTIQNATILKYTGVPTTSPVLASYTPGTTPDLPKVTNGTNVTFQWHTNGLFVMDA